MDWFGRIDVLAIKKLDAVASVKTKGNISNRFLVCSVALTPPLSGNCRRVYRVDQRAVFLLSG